MKMPAEPFRSDFYLWQGYAAVFFSSCVTPVHAHNTLQILVDLQTNFKCRIGNGGWQTYRQLVIAENAPHQLDTNDSVQLLIYVDTETSTGHQIRSKYLQGKTHDVPAVELLILANPEALQRCLLKSEPILLHQIVTDI